MTDGQPDRPWNHRWIAYARAQGRSPTDQFEHDLTTPLGPGESMRRWIHSHRKGFEATMAEGDLQKGFFDGNAFTAYLDRISRETAPAKDLT